MMNFCGQINCSHVQDSNRNLKRKQYESFEWSRDTQTTPGTYSHLLRDIRPFLLSSKAYFCPKINLAPLSHTDTQTDICDVQIHRALKVPQSTQTGVRGLVPLSSQPLLFIQIVTRQDDMKSLERFWNHPSAYTNSAEFIFHIATRFEHQSAL